MSFMTRMKHATDHMLAARSPSGVNGRNLTGFVVDKAERYGASLGFGYLKGAYQEKMIWWGIGADVWLGGALTLGSVVMQAMSGGNSKVAPHLERVGDAGLQAAIHEYGVKMGMQKSGRVVAVLAEGGAGGKKKIAGYDHVLGMIPPAMGGAYLSAEEIAHFASKR